MNTKKNYFTCVICQTKFYSKWRKKQTCSAECLKRLKSTPEYKQNFLEKSKATFKKKYGVDNPAKAESIKIKQKETCLQRYGVISPTLNPEIRKKQEQTCRERYGVSNPLSSKIIQNKTKSSLEKNYGVKTTWKSKVIVDKSKRTKMERYGNENYNNIEKIKETSLKKYGTEFPMQSTVVKNIQRYKMRERYFEKILNSERFSDLIPLFDKNKYVMDLNRSLLYKFKCKKCNNEFESLIAHGIVPKCKICHPPFVSKSQSEIYEYIKSILPANEIIHQNTKFFITPFELDIYIPSKKLAIEFNELFCHSEIGGKKYKNYHINKTEKCKKEGIRLIHIFEDEWLNKQEIIKNRLKHILKLNTDKKIMGRRCVIKEIENTTAANFLDKYHIQGNTNSLIRLGAYYNDKLVSVMTFGKLRLSMGNKVIKTDEYEMYRFCVIQNIVGIASKLLSYFIKQYNPSKIVSYADRRWSDDNAFYSKIGFNLITKTLPNYWYIDSEYTRRYHRFSFRKDQLSKKLAKFDVNLTEWENMQLNGYDRIWDCGNLKYEWQQNK